MLRSSLQARRNQLPTLLIADDHPSIRKALRSVFSEVCKDAVCAEAENGAQAIQKALDLDPQVVILDLAMPEVNGLEAARVLKWSLPNTTLFLLTSYAHHELEMLAFESGITAVYSKTGDLTPLFTHVQQLLNSPASAAAASA